MAIIGTGAIGAYSGLSRAIPEFTKVGDWQKAIQLNAVLAPILRTSMQWASRKYAEKLVKMVKRNIITNQTPGPSAKTTKTGIKLYRTGLYYKSITTWQSAGERFVGIKENIKYTRATRQYGSTRDISVAMTARVNERGSFKNNNPARPVWKKTIEEMGGAAELERIFFETVGAKATALGVGDLFNNTIN